MDEEKIKQDLRVMISKEIHRFQAANGFKLSEEQIVDLFATNETWIFDRLFQVAKNGRTEEDFKKTTQEAISKILAPFIPATRSN